MPCRADRRAVRPWLKAGICTSATPGFSSLPYMGGQLNPRTRPASPTAEGKIDISVARSIPINVIVDTVQRVSRSLRICCLPAGAQTARLPGAYNYNSSGNTPVRLRSTTYRSTSWVAPGNRQGGRWLDNGHGPCGHERHPTRQDGLFRHRQQSQQHLQRHLNTNLTFNQNVAEATSRRSRPLGFNPLLNVSSVGGGRLPNQGYVVSNNQLVVGLTAANNSYSFVKLTQLSTPAPTSGRDPHGPVERKAVTYVPATVLHDTGIWQRLSSSLGGDGRRRHDRRLRCRAIAAAGAFYSFMCPAQCGGASSSPALCPVANAELGLDDALPQHRTPVLGLQLPVRPGQRLRRLRPVGSGLTTAATNHAPAGVAEQRSTCRAASPPTCRSPSSPLPRCRRWAAGRRPSTDRCSVWATP